MGQPSRVRRGAVLVARGDPAASFLLDKLTGSLRPREGKAMPLDPETGAPVTPSPLAGEFLTNVLRPWIEAGAPDD